MSNPDSFDDYVNVVSNFPLLVLLFGYKWTTVFHCSWEKGQKAFCNVATEETFGMANGVTISPDKKTVFVNDPLQSNKCEVRSSNLAILHITITVPSYTVL